MAKIFDVVVVGAGPAGLMAAKTASASGLKIALLERKTDISKIGRSDGGIIGTNHYLFGEVVKFNRKTQTFVFPVNGFTLQYKGPWNQDLYGFHVYSPGGKRFRLGDWPELKKDPIKNSQGIAISKGQLLKGILDEVRANDVAVFPNTNATNVRSIKDGAVITANSEDYQGRFVVAADGINSRMARLLGLNKKRKFSATSRNQTWLLEGLKVPDPEGLKFIITMYGIFALTTQAEAGQFHLSTFTSDPKVDLEALIQRFTMEDPVYSPWFQGATRTELKESCVVNVWQAIERPYKDHVILAGDACWSQEFSITASLCAGHRLGHALTKAFHDRQFDAKGIAPYLDWFTKYCYGPRGGEVLSGGVNLYDYLTADELDYLAALPKEPAPHTLSFYEFFATIMKTYGKLMPQIAKDRPEILEKLKTMGREGAEVSAGKRKAGFPNR